jgi:hypothetical protein
MTGLPVARGFRGIGAGNGASLAAGPFEGTLSMATRRFPARVHGYAGRQLYLMYSSD